ncbi:hypothetical protein [Actinomycetospora flava]|uniref:DUF4386 family protein n=1 Tax=Actinomycetospora flava TaxID=3129232 RepID=A0ABU8ME37_9PSEU
MSMPASGANPAVDVGSRTPVLDRWPALLLVAGVLGFVGSLLHPTGDPTLSGDAAVAAEIGDPLWTPSHLLLLVFVALLVPGFLGLARSGVLSGAARTAARVASGAAIVWVVESVPHLLAAADHHALLAGQPTPFLTAHTVTAGIVYPLGAFPIAALALLGGRRLAHPVLNVLGAVGAVAFGIAGFAAYLLGSEQLLDLFAGSMLLTAWIAVAGATALVRRRWSPSSGTEAR